MDGLTEEERSEAFKSGWLVSFDGWAVVDEDFLFRSVNPQWLEILGVSAHEFYGRSFTDITPPEVRHADIEQAKLVRDGKISSYTMHKEYEFSDGEKRRIILLVVRVPFDGLKPFQFYLSRIMMDEQRLEELASTTQKSTSLSLVGDKKTIWWTILSSLGLLTAFVIERLIGK
jgi:PAS domain S-box-containing protein